MTEAEKERERCAAIADKYATRSAWQRYVGEWGKGQEVAEKIAKEIREGK